MWCKVRRPLKLGVHRMVLEIVLYDLEPKVTMKAVTLYSLIVRLRKAQAQVCLLATMLTKQK